MINKISTKFGLILKSRYKNPEIACINPKYAYEYARDILKGPFELGEAIIATDSKQSYDYANRVLHGPFPLGEKAISTSPYYSFQYAMLLKRRFHLGERTISKSDLYKEKYEQFLNRFLIFNKFLNK